MSSLTEFVGAVLAASSATAPILVLSFAKHNEHRWDPRTAMKFLGLDKIADRAVCTRNVPESTDTGVAEGFEWLTEVMNQ